ncbi:MAG TPA: hypothetical protein VJ673_04430 [Aromatoleum sp.]|uniref:hypothetical protein n=1 Tax=Aromatoleum sp. TaxID=2307007 RepID=UPI002B4A2381|nr:hypothetical protein [Aromatoleum sp.]HJV24907.1 hypothetical protein [Aromatoleum sp.]
MPPISHRPPIPMHQHDAHGGHLHAHAHTQPHAHTAPSAALRHGSDAAPPFPATALVLGAGARIAVAAAAATLLWIIVGWALA